jgi:hypothetical protein
MITSTIISVLFIGILIGAFITFLTFFFLNKFAERKVKNQNQSVYQEILDKVNSNDISFGSRINNTVQILANIKSEGDVQIMYFLDKKEIAIFRENDCLYTSVFIKSETLDGISRGIWSKFSNQINDVVSLSNNIFDKRTFVLITGLSNAETFDGFDDNEFTESHNLDDILDRINKVGYENLTESEKEFLKNIK